jgi:hypothetical protein
LQRRIRLNQARGRPLHRQANPTQQFADVSRMIHNTEFVGNDLRKINRSPDARVQTIGHWPAIHDIV